MSFYIYKDEQQLGPYDEESIVEQIQAGTIGPDVFGIRTGDSQWEKLSTLFPQMRFVQQPGTDFGPQPLASVSARMPEYRRTLWLKLIFGALVLAAVGSCIAATYYLNSMPSDPEFDKKYPWIGLIAILVRNFRVGAFLFGVFAVLGLMVAFKKSLIESNPLRIALRSIFVLVMLAGTISVLAGIGSFLFFDGVRANSADPSARKYDGVVNATRQYQGFVVWGQLGLGVLLFGASGLLMTKSRRNS